MYDAQDAPQGCKMVKNLLLLAQFKRNKYLSVFFPTDHKKKKNICMDKD